ncbi:MAG TPA: hypothetical protein VM536_14320 [Chloroflexia bacterium]|nr:hypothetical protein [Chloroflexia bacterium]
MRNVARRPLLVVGLALLFALLVAGMVLPGFFAPGGREGYAVPDGGTPAAPPSATTQAPRPSTVTLSATATLPAVPTVVLTAAPSATASPPTVLPPTAPPSPTAFAAAGDMASPTPTAGPTDTPLPEETPLPEAWLHRSTAHYDLYYLPGSQADRDSATLGDTAEAAMTAVAINLQASPITLINVYFANRIFWQGGASYPGNELLLSYPERERDYTSTSLATVLRHETTHALVEQLLGSDRHKGGLLGEGTAVWAAGGHYQMESLEVLASTLITDNAPLYLPLADLRRDFYGAQHELAYLEGGAYVKFMVERWGLPKFKQYLAHPDDPQPIYGLDSAALETEWRAWLAAVPHTAADTEAVRLRVRYYDLMRRYEMRLDADARILPGTPPSRWGPTLIRIMDHVNPAAANAALERQFVQAGTALWAGDLALCATLLDRLATAIG